MTKTIYAIDKRGVMTYDTLEIGIDEPVPSGYVDVPLPTDGEGNQLPFWMPHWTGTRWEELRAKEEIEMEKLKPQPQSELELKLKERDLTIAKQKHDFEIAIIEIWETILS